MPGDASGSTTPSPKKSPKQSSSAESSPTRSPSSTEPSSSPSSSPSAASGTGLAAQRAFLDDYFSKAPGGTDEGWALLTPSYQAQVGRSSYDGFWRTISSVSVSNVTDAGGDAVEATLAYTKGSGGTTTERHRIELVPSGDGYLIDGDTRA